MSMVISGDNGLTFPAGSTQVQAGNYQTMVNRIINGRMEIDQRNAGASISTNGGFPVDRFKIGSDTTTFTAQQSTTTTAGFKNSLLYTVGTGGSPTAAQQNQINHFIEGFNVADLNWGTANAQTVTLSFWVRSSVTGTFAGSLMNNAYNRAYVFTYSIASANTWTQISVTIAGDTTGTWTTDNTAGIRITFDLGSGSNYNATANTWSAGEYRRTSGSVNLVATAGATFYITGVDLRVGSYTVVPQDFRAYGTELALCQRYYWRNTPLTVRNSGLGVGFQTSTTVASAYIKFPVSMRTDPTASQSNTIISDGATYDADVTGIGGILTTYDSCYINVNFASAGAQFRPCMFRSKNAGTVGFVDFSAEL